MYHFTLSSFCIFAMTSVGLEQQGRGGGRGDLNCHGDCRNKRPHMSQHCLFLLSFLVTFSTLFLGSHVLNAKLKETGYDISRLVLIGLELHDNTTPKPNTTMAFNLEYTQLIALALTIVSSTFIYFKFISSSKFCISFISHPPSTPCIEQKPVLDPKLWQEFTLAKMLIVSPNTTMCPLFSSPSPPNN